MTLAGGCLVCHNGAMFRPRRTLIAAVWVLAAYAACGPLAAAARDSGPARPSFLFILTDDQRHDALSCRGRPVVRTPHLDRLAAEGVFFENAFVTTSICAASRASILTGQFERTHGFTFGTPPLTLKQAGQAYPALLRAAGYRTGLVGKFGVAFERGGTDAMFDDFAPLNRSPYLKKLPDGTQRHLTRIEGDRAVDFLRGCTADRPFCLSVSFNAPHAEDADPRQYVYDPAHADLFRGAVVPAPRLADPKYFDLLPDFLRTGENRNRWGWRFDTPEKYQEMVKGYYRMIYGVDEQVGRLREELKRLGLDRNTVVFFTSDNGYFLADRGLADKWLIYDESVRVPLIVFDPRLGPEHRGARRSGTALNVDLAPTMLEMAGLAPPKEMQGRSLVPLLEGRQPPDWRTDFFYEHLFDHRGIPKSEGVRGARWTYVRYFEQTPVHEQLFDRQTDPDEVVDLARDPRHRDKLEEMRKRCDELRDGVGGPFVPRPKPAKPKK